MSKFEPKRLAEYTDDAILAEIRRVAEMVGGPTLSTVAFNKYGRVGLTTVRRRFGGWQAALSAADLGHLYRPVPPARISRTRARSWTKNQIIEELKRVAASLGRESLTVADFKRSGKIGPDAVRNRFDGWQQALRAAGLKPVNHGRRYSDEDCFENLLKVWAHYGRPPKYQEMNIMPSSVGGKAYTVRWGTWNKAVHAFTARIDSEDEELAEGPDPRQATIDLRLGSKRKPEDNRDPRLGLRFKVLKRDRYRCVACGRSPATDLSCVLHVDHVLPFSKGGKTTFENLQTLCEECNLGKGNSH